jgi:hypothetical protein
MDENFPGKPGFPGFYGDFRVVPNLKKNKITYPQFILSTLKCNSMTPKALKLHLQSIKLFKSFYSSNLCCEANIS